MDKRARELGADLVRTGLKQTMSTNGLETLSSPMQEQRRDSLKISGFHKSHSVYVSHNLSVVLSIEYHRSLASAGPGRTAAPAGAKARGCTTLQVVSFVVVYNHMDTSPPMIYTFKTTSFSGKFVRYYCPR